MKKLSTSSSSPMLLSKSLPFPSSAGIAKNITNKETRPHYFSASKLKNKYSRFCAGIDFNGVDIGSIQRKSDAWMVKFMEICYDDAFQLFSLPTDAIAMDLPSGGFENFPILVQRNINNLYSVLEIRKNVCLELLFSIELIMDKIERYRFSASRPELTDPDESEYDSGRVLLFSKFLSEEYDMDVLMIFLHSRSKMEGSLGKKLRYINATRIYDVKGKVSSLQHNANDSLGNELDKYGGSSSGNGIKTTGSKKVVPYSLPVKWRFLTDVTLPEVPVVAFHASLLHHIMFTILDKLTDEVKEYLLTLIYKMVIKDNMSISPSAAGAVPVPSHIPIYTIFRVLCAEYCKVTSDVKSKMNDTYIVVQSLGTLNTLCDNNNAIANEFQEKILGLETKLSQLNLNIMQLQKKLKRCNKTFTNKLHQDGSLLDSITILKQDILIASNQKQEVEQELLQVNKAFHKHKAHIDNLWKQISTHSLVSTKQEKKTLKAPKKRVETGEESKTVTAQQQSALWRGKVLTLMHKILQYNREQYLENKERENAKRQKTISDLIALPAPPSDERDSSGSPSTETKEQLKGETIVSPANRLLLVETLSRLFVHNVIKQCVYKQVVQKKLELQQHALLLTYNTEYYQKEQARLKRLEEERKRQIWMQAKKVMVNIFTSDLVQQSLVPMATKAAFKVLYNTFYYLDLPDKEYIPIYQLFQVDRKFQALSKRILKKCFRKLGEPRRIAKVTAMHKARRLRRVFDYLHSTYMAYRYKTQQILCMQQNARKFLFSLRLYKYISHLKRCNIIADQMHRRRMLAKADLYIKHWRQYTHDQMMTRQLNAVIMDRTYLKCFYTWIYLYKQIILRRFLEGKEKLAKCITVQRYARGYIVRSKVRLARLRRRIYDAVIIYQSKQIRYRLLQRRRQYVEFAAHLAYRNRFFTYQCCLRLWTKKYCIMQGSARLLSCFQMHLKKERLKKWHEYYLACTAFRLRHLILIQAVARMFIVHRRLCYFPSWRPKLIRLQARVRGYLAWKRFRIRIFYHRKAIILQRNVRKFLVIKFLKYRRVAQIHQDAADNNFAKIQFYLNNYRELLYEPDQDGNSILHTAAKHACKRVLKLLIKARLYEDINLYNTQGYTPLHMLLMSTNLAMREEVCHYFLERGFDEDIHTQFENRSCLLVAILADNTGIASQLIDDGHDVNYADNMFLTCLQAACYNGNARLIELLIQHGAEVNVMGYASRYPIHDAVLSGNINAFYSLLQHPQIDLGMREEENQQTPLMFACIYSQPEYVKNLLIYHAKRVIDSRHERRLALQKKRSSMSTLSSQSAYPVEGSYDILPDATDSYKRTAAHYAAIVPDTSCLDHLRSADIDLEAVDSQGNTPLHLATINKNYQNVKFLLETGVYASYQNEDGNHAIHLAAMDDGCVNILAMLCQYDEQIGRLNYAHQSVWAIAQYYQAKANLKFLQSNYSRVDKNLEGHEELAKDIDRHWETPWDADITKHVSNIVADVLPSGERSFVNTMTGERTMAPPTMSSQAVVTRALKIALPVQRAVTMVTNQDLLAHSNKVSMIDDGASVDSSVDNATVNVYTDDNIVLDKFNYREAFKDQQEEIKVIAVNHFNATIIVKWAKRKLAYNKLRRMKALKKAKKNILVFLRRHLPGFMAWRRHVYHQSAQRIQAVIRGHITRQYFYNKHYLYYDHWEFYSSYEMDPMTPKSMVKYHKLIGQHHLLRHKYYQRRLYAILARMYKYYKVRGDYRLFQYLLRNLPAMTIEDWGKIIYQAKWPVRTAGMYEVYQYPGSRNLLFYRHIMTGQCSFQKPRKLAYLDEQEEREAAERLKYGATLHQIALVIKLQSMWRGYSIRNYYKKVEKSLEISRFAEEKYLTAPGRDLHAYNYALFLLTFDQDIPHSRRVFMDALRRMQHRGPDVAFVLFSYAIYAMKSGDEEWEDIIVLRDRARKAERIYFLELRTKLSRQAHREGTQLNGMSSSQNNASTLSAKLRAEVQQARQFGADEDRTVQTSLDDGSIASQADDGSVTEEKLEGRVGRYGKSYDLAHVGFFRYCAQSHNNAFGYELLALCRFLVYDDFSGAFRSFMQAFHYAPDDPALRHNFDLMLTHYFGKSRAKKDMIVRSKMQEQAQIDADMEESRRIIRDHATLRFNCASRIQYWYRERRAARLFRKFIAAANERIQEMRSSSTRKKRRDT